MGTTVKSPGKVGITGGDGFIGWHLRVLLSTKPGVVVVPITEDDFASPETLAPLLEGLDALVHLAGVNRAGEGEVAEGNRTITTTLIEAMGLCAAGPARVIFSSTTYAESPTTEYGRAKREASDRLAEYLDGRAEYCELVIPHVFGEFGRPFYNSVTATFCHQLATGAEPVVENDAALELVHVGTVTQRIWQLVTAASVQSDRLVGEPMRVSELLSALRGLWDSYAETRVPDLSRPFDVDLFNCLRSYIPPDGRRRAVVTHEDDRGSLFNAVQVRSPGQSIVSTTKPGVVRGGHFHFRKFERFLVLRGQALIRFRRPLVDDLLALEVSGDTPTIVDIPTLTTHDIENVGAGELLTMFWSNEWFDPDAPDTFPHPVHP